MDAQKQNSQYQIKTESEAPGLYSLYSPALESATLLFQMAPGLLIPYEFGGVKHEIDGYRKSAWIGTTLMISPIYDVYGPDAVKFLNSICINDFTKLTTKGLRHAVICNESGQVLTDGVVIRIAEDRYRTYWLNPPIDFLLKESGMDVYGEDVTGTEYFIQIAGEKSLEILEDAFEADLHDIKFATHRKAMMGDKAVEVVRLGMSGNLSYEVHGPMNEFDEVYRKIWASGEKYGATKLGLHAYNLFNHTEAGFPNINLHYPLPWFETSEAMTKYMYENPQYSMYNINRKLLGSVGDDLQSRFVTPYDVGWGFLVKFNHDFTGREALEKIAQNPPRTAVTLEWHADDIGAVYATMFKPGEAPCDNIAPESDVDVNSNAFFSEYAYRADRVQHDGQDIGISSGRIVSYHYNSMISLGFIDPKFAEEGTELTLIWGTPGTKQMNIRVKVAKMPYNADFIRNENKDVSEIPHYQK
ncbi:aminomethyltransferase family protein [Fusibacter paucivorans]|uniref:Aminomethyltransferase family protein n=1 Tax=Fusibacter paucivorans TaxID=76009 RepID=A0ABS5PJ63_9FIRM|nr:aminomethyl transferase family protein [Fusibacter paucivorans]MBS7525144.1 aminomethyltransferase family protein [Fusibacter paucivorans]